MTWASTEPPRDFRETRGGSSPTFEYRDVVNDNVESSGCSLIGQPETIYCLAMPNIDARLISEM